MDTYTVFSPAEVITYVRTMLPDFSPDEELQATRLTGSNQSVDGRVNAITIIRSATGKHSLVCKQIMPYVKLSEESPSYTLPMERFSLEIHSLTFWDSICPGSVPRLYLTDERNSLMLMEDLSHLTLLSVELLKGSYLPNLSRQLGEFLGKTAFYTSRLFLTQDEMYQLKQLFTVCNTKTAWDHFMFTGTILQPAHPSVNPHIQESLEHFCKQPRIRQATLRLRDIYMEKQHCLIHSDLHSSNILVDRQTMKVLDTEYATYGPVSFDIGRLISSFILSYGALLPQDLSLAKKIDYPAYLLSLIEETYHHFETSLEAAWKQHLPKDRDYHNPYNQFFRKTILQETLGFAACAAISRIYDGGLPFDFKEIPDLKQRAMGLTYILHLAEYLLVNNHRLTSITHLTRHMKALSIG